MDDSISGLSLVIQTILPDMDEWTFLDVGRTPPEIENWLHNEDYKYPPPLSSSDDIPTSSSSVSSFTSSESSAYCSPSAPSDPWLLPPERPQTSPPDLGLSNAVSSSDLDVFAEFFPQAAVPVLISPHSVCSSSSPSNSSESLSPMGFYQDPPQQWAPPPSVHHFHSFNYAPPLQRPAPAAVKPSRQRSGKPAELCSNCRTTTSTMWRWNTKTGERECNACNLYEAHNNKKRPPELWKGKILTRRKRNPNKNQTYAY